MVVPTLTTDDTDITDTAGPVSFATLFTTDFGADGFKDADDNDDEDADAIAYTLGIGAGASGLVDTLTADEVQLSLIGTDVVVGTVNDGADEVFRVSVDADTGAVTLTQSRSVVHDDPLDPDETGTSAAKLTAAGLITLTATITDGDLDKASETVDITDAFAFEDDGPSISRNAVVVPTLTTDDTDITDTAGPVSFATLFTTDFGADGFKDADDNDDEDADAIAYTLGIGAGASGLVDTLTADEVQLSLIGTDVVVGTVNDGADEVFRVSVDADTGAVTLTQSRSVVHDDPLDPDETGTSAAKLTAAGLITLTATITDGDLDKASETVDITDAFAFEDDGPSISRNAVVVPTLTTDDTDITDTAGPVSFATLFTTDFGADGFKDADDNDDEDADAIAYTLGIGAGASGLVDTLTADEVQLSLIGTDVVVGTVNDGADEVFRVSVDADTGAVTLTQSRSVVHDDPLDPDETGTSAAKLTAAGLITLTATITDGDLDKASETVDITDAFAFEDDGPSISRNAVVVPTLTTDDTDITDTAGPVSFATLFTTDFGADGFKDADDNDDEDADAIAYTLGIGAGASGLVDTLTADEVQLSLIGTDVVVGTVNDGADEVFRVSVDADTGAVTLTQSRSVVHDDPLDPDETGNSAAKLAAAGLITLTATITDGDLDTASETADITGLRLRG